MAGNNAEAVVVGSGPNGLTAAIALARAGLRVTVFEAQPNAGGGVRSAGRTLAGFIHDVCSAVHPMAVSSPAFAAMPLAEYGLEWIQPEIPAAHPLDGGRAAVAERTIEATAERLGTDGAAYRRAMAHLVHHWHELMQDVLSPPRFPRHPLLLAKLGSLAAWPATAVARSLFRNEEARALFAGMAAHSILPLNSALSAAFGLIFCMSANAVGWPIARGGSQKIADALTGYLHSLGGQVLTSHEVCSLRELPPRTLILCDVTPRQLLRLAGDRLPDAYCRKLESFRYGPGVFRIDWALNAPIPWENAACRRAGTIHAGGTLEEIAISERAAWEGRICARPFVLLSQPSLFDGSRAPAGKHTAWAYCHVPNASPEDMTGRIESQIERFAPGFREQILARRCSGPAEMEVHNANLIGGDISGGAANPRQLFFRPTAKLYRTPDPWVYLCSSSTPPGAGVHGMCGWHAARAALRDSHKRQAGVAARTMSSLGA